MTAKLNDQEELCPLSHKFIKHLSLITHPLPNRIYDNMKTKCPNGSNSQSQGHFLE